MKAHRKWQIRALVDSLPSGDWLLVLTCAPKIPPNLCRVRPTQGRTSEGTIHRRADHSDDQRTGSW